MDEFARKTKRATSDGEVVWARYPGADINLLKKLTLLGGDGGNQAGLRGEHEGNR